MEGTEIKIEPLITSLSHRKGRGKIPKFQCVNCKCTRYYPCYCPLTRENAKAEFKRIKGIK